MALHRVATATLIVLLATGCAGGGSVAPTVLPAPTPTAGATLVSNPTPVPTSLPAIATAAPPTPSIPATAINVTPPVQIYPPFRLIATPADGIAPLSVTFRVEITASFSLACTGQYIDFGDGTVEQRIVPSCGLAGLPGELTPTPQTMSRMVTHVYTRAGAYKVTICTQQPCRRRGV